MRSTLLRLALLAALLMLAAGARAAFDARVEAAQRALTEQGYQPGPVDGLMGRRTRGALRAFQRASGLPETGRIDQATAAALGLDESGSAPSPEAVEAAPRPASPPVVVETRPAPPLLSYRRLGWLAPDSASGVLERSRTATGITEVRSKRGQVTVSDPTHVYVLRAGEQVGAGCRPAAGALTMEFLVGQGGPVSFKSGNASGYCQLGIGIVLAEGMQLRMLKTYWGDTVVPGGTVRVGRRGLEYVR